MENVKTEVSKVDFTNIRWNIQKIMKPKKEKFSLKKLLGNTNRPNDR